MSYNLDSKINWRRLQFDQPICDKAIKEFEKICIFILLSIFYWVSAKHILIKIM